MMSDPSLVFLAIPDSIKEKLALETNPSELDPSILLPVELEAGGEIDPAKLSKEAIISGMLRVIVLRSRNDPVIISTLAKKEIPDEWVDYYRRFVLAVRPEIFHELSSAAIVKAGNREFELALEISAILEGLFPLSPGVLLNKALILEEKADALEKSGRDAEQENEAALEAYETALSLQPVLPDTLFNAGFFFLHRREFARAKDCFSRYVLIGDESEIPLDIPANKKRQAKKIIRDINEQGLDDKNFNEAYDCINTGDNEQGLAKIRAFIERHPKAWNGWFLLGWALRKSARYGDGHEALKKAFELGGDNCDVLNEIAICLMEQGDLKGAKGELTEALKREPENTKIISNLAVLAQKCGNLEEAAAFYRTVLELDASDPLAKRFLSLYYGQ